MTLEQKYRLTLSICTWRQVCGADSVCLKPMLPVQLPNLAALVRTDTNATQTGCSDLSMGNNDPSVIRTSRHVHVFCLERFSQH